MEAITAYKIVILIFRQINFMLHSTGCYLLICLYKNGSSSTQQLFLINLSVIIALRNLLIIPVLILDLVPHNEESEFIQDGGNGYIIEITHKILRNMIATTVFFLYYMSMYYLTLDRLLAVCLHFRYSTLCTIGRVKLLLLVTWFIGFGLIICLSILSSNGIISSDYTPYDYYAYLSLALGFIILAIFTYGILFHSFRKSLELRTRSSLATTVTATRLNSTSNIYAVFRQSNFYISILLITNFVVFLVAPDLLYLFDGLRNKFSQPDDNLVEYIVVTMYVISDLIDAYIYIFIKKNVRDLLEEKLKVLRRLFVRQKAVSTHLDVPTHRRDISIISESLATIATTNF